MTTASSSSGHGVQIRAPRVAVGPQEFDQLRLRRPGQLLLLLLPLADVGGPVDADERGDLLAPRVPGRCAATTPRCARGSPAAPAVRRWPVVVLVFRDVLRDRQRVLADRPKAPRQLARSVVRHWKLLRCRLPAAGCQLTSPSSTCCAEPVGEVQDQADHQPPAEPLPRRRRQAVHDEQARRRAEQRHRPDERHAERTRPARAPCGAARARRRTPARTRTACRCSSGRTSRRRRRRAPGSATNTPVMSVVT